MAFLSSRWGQRYLNGRLGTCAEGALGPQLVLLRRVVMLLRRHVHVEEAGQDAEQQLHLEEVLERLALGHLSEDGGLPGLGEGEVEEEEEEHFCDHEEEEGDEDDLEHYCISINQLLL